MLIDPGSTNGFIEPTILQKLRIRSTRTCPLIVTVANDNRTVSRDEVTQLSW